MIRDFLGDILCRHYHLQVAKDGETALRVARRCHLDLIILDGDLPDMDGFEVCTALKADPRTAGVPVMFITGLSDDQDQSRGFGLGAVDYITKPFSVQVVLARIRAQLALANQQRQLELLVRERTVKLEQNGLELIRQLGRAAELRDNETGLHVIRVSDYAYHIARAAGVGEDRARLIRTVAPLHDVGKIGIPDQILLKPGPLDADEWHIIRTHCELGYRIIGNGGDELMQTAALCAYCHHERWDGGGYPRRLSGEEIPLVARVLAVADVFDALTCARPYKRAWRLTAAVEEIERCAGSQFDPAMVDAFLDVLPQIGEVMKIFSETGVTETGHYLQSAPMGSTACKGKSIAV